MLIFRQLFDAASSTYTYLLGHAASGQALLIDPVFEHVLRSAQAAVLLAKAGIADVANLAGGLLRWRAAGQPVQGGAA